MSDIDAHGNCSKCGGVHYGTGPTCVYEQPDLGRKPPWPKIRETAHADLKADMATLMDAFERERAEVKRLAAKVQASEPVVQWAQATLTALNVGHVQSESPLHKKLREVMIAYRAALAELAPPSEPEGGE